MVPDLYNVLGDREHNLVLQNENPLASGQPEEMWRSLRSLRVASRNLPAVCFSGSSLGIMGIYIYISTLSKWETYSVCNFYVIYHNVQKQILNIKNINPVPKKGPRHEIQDPDLRVFNDQGMPGMPSYQVLSFIDPRFDLDWPLYLFMIAAIQLVKPEVKTGFITML